MRWEVNCLTEAIYYTVTSTARPTACPNSHTSIEAIPLESAGVPPVALKFYAASTLLPTEKAILAVDWTDAIAVLGGVCSSPDFFIPNLAKALGRCVGQAKAIGSGAQLRVVEKAKPGADPPESDAVLATFDVPDSTDAWVDIGFTTGTPRSGQRTFELQGKKGTATSASVRYTSLSLLEVTP